MKNEKKIFLTGGTGFIGKNILEQLNDKYEIIAPTRQELDLIDTKKVYNFLKKNNFSLIIHTANIGGTRNALDIPNITYTNLKIFFNLRRGGNFYKKIIFLGTGAEYGKDEKISYVKETDFDKNIPKDEYGFYKYACAKYTENMDDILHLRLFAVFGKYEDYRIRFISNIICQALLNMPITINQNRNFNFLYIDDFVKILDFFISKEKTNHKFYNIGSDYRLDFLSITKKILNLLKKDLPITIKLPGLGHEYTCNIDRLKNEIDELKFIEFDTALKILIDYYKSILETIDKNSLLLNN
jgi:GDP-L-fucose synthase